MTTPYSRWRYMSASNRRDISHGTSLAISRRRTLSSRRRIIQYKMRKQFWLRKPIEIVRMNSSVQDCSHYTQNNNSIIVKTTNTWNTERSNQRKEKDDRSCVRESMLLFCEWISFFFFARMRYESRIAFLCPFSIPILRQFIARHLSITLCRIQK